MTPQIRCYLFDNHHGLIFNPDSVRILREQYRIIGCLKGNHAEYPRQNNELSVPLELSLEECFLLTNRHIMNLCQIIQPILDCESDRIRYLAQLDGEFHKQKLANGHARINEIMLNRQSILRSNTESVTIEDDPFLEFLLATNHTWQNCSRSMDDHDRQCLLMIIARRLRQFTFEQMLIEIPVESRRENLQLRLISNDELKQNLSPLERLRCDVFADLYSRHEHYWISNGHKFGGDFLVYLDDPSRCHSTFIIVCTLRTEVENDDTTIIPLTHLIARCRVAVNVNKTFVLASRKTTNDIDYLSINWTGF